VIRRVFWVSVGAAAGITGYRRATAMGQAISVRLTGRLPGEPAPRGAVPALTAAEPRRATDRRAGGPAGRDPGPSGPGERPVLRRAPARGVAGGSGGWSPRGSTLWRTSRAAWRAQRAGLARIRAAGLFARDVREGMDMYLNRQEGQPGPTLADTTRNRRPPARPQ
jgi:hypothetical protein